MGVLGVFGSARSVLSAVFESDGQLCYYTQTENIKHFEWCVVSEVHLSNVFMEGSINSSFAR